MILLYTSLLLLLGFIKLLVSLRARALERKYVRVAAEVDITMRDANVKPGNGSKLDAGAIAKRTLILGQMVQDRDRVESKFFTWQRWTERFANWMRAVREWKGRKLPYTLGAVDVWMVLSLVDYVGVGEYLSAMAFLQTALALWGE